MTQGPTTPGALDGVIAQIVIDALGPVIDELNRRLNAHDAPISLTIADAAAKVPCSRAHLENLIRKGQGPRVRRLGKSVRILPDDLTDWLRNLDDGRPVRPVAKRRAS